MEAENLEAKLKLMHERLNQVESILYGLIRYVNDAV
jgi:hypothetical protein